MPAHLCFSELLPQRFVLTEQLSHQLPAALAQQLPFARLAAMASCTAGRAARVANALQLSRYSQPWRP